ncbi:PH domain-containing protein [Lysinimonas soli]|uniref:PH domain-containing protein n=1 Tax=Lysinimonas soli TaxID=1074233 RepID=A0ABW0NRZ7_9MICO
MTIASVAEDLADGEWHRLHPATPLLRGGFAFVAIAGFVLANLRERIFEFFVGGGPQYGGDPIDIIVRRGLIPIALLVVLGVLVVIIVMFWLSWRVHSFRITDELVEVRSGILFRTNRRGRLDRIQGINVGRPLFARLFGAARLDINVAGHDANVQLAYLSGRNADALRQVILQLASGTAASDGAATAPEHDGTLAGIVGQRAKEFIAPERNPDLAPPGAVVTMHLGRLLGSTVLHDRTVIFVLLVVAGAVLASVAHVFVVLFVVIPALFGIGSQIVRRFSRSLRYSIAATPDGVRVGYGLLSMNNETLPPGRIHSVEISQPLLWRPADWWEVRINLAAHSDRAEGGRRTSTILPVGSRAEVFQVLELVLPDLVDDGAAALIEAGLARSRRDDGYRTSPRRAAVLRWFSWRRNGFALEPQAVLLRRGAIWRSLVVVPTARMQSVSVHQGPLLRLLRLADVHVHTVAGPIRATLGALDAQDAARFFREVAASGIAAAAADRSHRWRASGATTTPRRARPNPAELRPGALEAGA